MVRITIEDRRGDEHDVDVQPGLTLMEAIRNEGLDELLATCGGCCSCATCHVYVIQPPPGATLPDVSPDEDDLLDMSDHRKPESRLSCQIRLTEELATLRAAIAPED